jgi:transcriptional regulator with XRE-family HTH domain
MSPSTSSHPKSEQTAESEIVALGRKLRELRQVRVLSLSDVAAETNISASMLSQLERGIVAPSLATLHTLAQFYDTRLFELFQEGGTPNGFLVRKRDRIAIHLPRSDATYELISGVRQDLQLVEMTVTRGQGTTDHTLSHPGEECVLVLEGSVRANVGDEQYDLEVGDSLQYSATIPHNYQALNCKKARLIVAMTPPTF